MLALRESRGFRYGVMARSHKGGKVDHLMRMKDNLREKRKSSKKPRKTKVDQREELEAIFEQLKKKHESKFLDHS